MAAVSLEKLSKTFPGKVQAVRDFDLEIEEGEFLVLVGPSGCGKSTLLRMIAGLETITSGTLGIGGQVVNRVPPQDRDIAMVFQNYALYPHMTVAQNMAFALKMRKVPKAEIQTQIAWAADMLGLKDLLKRKPKALSGGQRQRVALGRAMVRKPAVFLFDEPLSNLDAKLRVETRAEIKRLHRQLKTTTIYVTHDQEEAMTLGDRVVVMCDGQQHQCAPPLEIYRRPADRFVAGFLGMPPMNFFEGQLENLDGKLGFVNPDVRWPLPDMPLEWLAGTKRRPIVAGIRPESIQLCAIGNDTNSVDSHRLAATVLMTEPLGSTMDVYLETSIGHSFVCRAPAQTITEGQAVLARVAPSQIHLFETNAAATNAPNSPGSPVFYGKSLRTLAVDGV